VSQPIESLTSAAIIAPVWLQSALSVLLLATPNLELAACTTTVPALLSQGDLNAEDEGGMPALVILYAASEDDLAFSQVRQIKEAWPGARCLALVDAGRQRPSALAAGADRVLLKGTPATQLSAAIRTLVAVDSPVVGDVSEA
jgi:DNA-binding NarL/FixJ family response regulator